MKKKSIHIFIFFSYKCNKIWMGFLFFIFLCRVKCFILLYKRGKKIDWNTDRIPKEKLQDIFNNDDDLYIIQTYFKTFCDYLIHGDSWTYVDIFVVLKNWFRFLSYHLYLHLIQNRSQFVEKLRITIRCIEIGISKMCNSSATLKCIRIQSL